MSIKMEKKKLSMLNIIGYSIYGLYIIFFIISILLLNKWDALERNDVYDTIIGIILSVGGMNILLIGIMINRFSAFENKYFEKEK